MKKAEYKTRVKRGFKTRAEYQKWYRETHPEYVKRCRELEMMSEFGVKI